MAAGEISAGAARARERERVACGLLSAATHPSFPSDPGLALGVSASTCDKWGLRPPSGRPWPSRANRKSPSCSSKQKAIRKAALQPGTRRQTRAAFARPQCPPGGRGASNCFWEGWRRYHHTEPALSPPCCHAVSTASVSPFSSSSNMSIRNVAGEWEGAKLHSLKGSYLAGANTKGNS